MPLCPMLVILGLAMPPARLQAPTLAVLVILGFAMRPAWLQARMVGADGLEPPTLSV